MASRGDYNDFREAVKKRESGGNYTVRNPYGYLGAYQFGMARLTDLGLAQRLPGTSGYGNENFTWSPGYSQSGFLSDRTLQDRTFDRHVSELSKRLVATHPGLITGGINAQGRKITLSGAIGGSHLVGKGAVDKYIKSGIITRDANQTSVEEYLDLFNDYNIGGEVTKEIVKKNTIPLMFIIILLILLIILYIYIRKRIK